MPKTNVYFRITGNGQGESNGAQQRGNLMRQNLAQLVEAGLGLVKILKNAGVLDRLAVSYTHLRAHET